MSICKDKEQNKCLREFNEVPQDLALCMCPLECNLTEYKTRLSTTRLIGQFFLDHIEANEHLLEDFNDEPDVAKAALTSVAVNVFYDSFTYTISTETPQMNMVSLLASIGGNLGLFLGLSAFSFLELAQLVVELRRCVCWKRRFFSMKSSFSQCKSRIC